MQPNDLITIRAIFGKVKSNKEQRRQARVVAIHGNIVTVLTRFAGKLIKAVIFKWEVCEP